MSSDYPNLLSRDAQSFVYNFKIKTVQRMLDFDFIVGRKTPSVVALIKPTSGGTEKVFWGTKEVLMPVYTSLDEAISHYPNVSIMINFASARSAFSSTMQALDMASIKTIIIIAEGVPEHDVRIMIKKSKELNKTVIGPATVGGIQGGAFRIGDCAGTIENIVSCGLYRPGSVALASKSGGMSNELYNMIGRHTDGVYEGIAIGGDTFACTTLSETVLRFQQIPQVKMIVVLGELGGIDEYAVCDLLKSGKVNKPVVAWVSGTCANVFKTEVQFGHAGAKSGGDALTSAPSKTEALRNAGAYCPQSFDTFGELIGEIFTKTTGIKKIEGIHAPVEGFLTEEEVTQRIIEMKTRKTTHIVSTICDDRGEEPLYCGIQISQLANESDLGKVITLLWFKKSMPHWATKFIELCIILTADHGPCVSGAHNTIIAARAGKDLVSAVCSGLLTIGPRFGGAIDEAGRIFYNGLNSRLSPFDLVENMKQKGVPISGIGHRIKSLHNPDKRVQLLKEYAKNSFPDVSYLNYALDIERITTQKGANLILNVDGCIGALFLDCIVNSQCFTAKEIDEVIEIGSMNGIFLLARTIGLIGHVYDQKRLKQSLYRHPWEDVLYSNE